MKIRLWSLDLKLFHNLTWQVRFSIQADNLSQSQPLKQILSHGFDWIYLWMLDWFWNSVNGVLTSNKFIISPVQSNFAFFQTFFRNHNSVKIIVILHAVIFDRIKIARECMKKCKIGLYRWNHETIWGQD